MAIIAFCILKMILKINKYRCFSSIITFVPIEVLVRSVIENCPSVIRKMLLHVVCLHLLYERIRAISHQIFILFFCSNKIYSRLIPEKNIFIYKLIM